MIGDFYETIGSYQYSSIYLSEALESIKRRKIDSPIRYRCNILLSKVLLALGKEKAAKDLLQEVASRDENWKFLENRYLVSFYKTYGEIFQKSDPRTTAMYAEALSRFNDSTDNSLGITPIFHERLIETDSLRKRIEQLVTNNQNQNSLSRWHFVLFGGALVTSLFIYFWFYNVEDTKEGIIDKEETQHFPILELKNGIQIPVDRIACLRKKKNYVSVFFKDQKEEWHVEKDRITLEGILKKLPRKYFVQTHQSFILNISYYEGENIKENRTGYALLIVDLSDLDSDLKGRIPLTKHRELEQAFSRLKKTGQ